MSKSQTYPRHAPKSTDVAVVRQTVGRLGINYYRIDANANPSRFSTPIAPKFCISAHGAIAHPYVKPTALASVLSLGRIRGFGKSCAALSALCDRVSYELGYTQARPWCGVFH